MKVKFEFELDLGTKEGIEVHARILKALCPMSADLAIVGVDLASTPDRTVVSYVPVPEIITVPTVETVAPVVVVAPPVVTPLAVVTEYVAPVVTPAVVVPEGTYTLNQLAVAASQQLVDTGRRQELIDVLGQFGIAKMTDLPVEKYSAFAAHLKAKGVNL